MSVAHISIDKGKDGKGPDLLKEEPYGSHVKMAEEHKVDGYHGSPACSSFSAVRFRKGGPEPVRNALHPYGFPSNSLMQQAEADWGDSDGVPHGGHCGCGAKERRTPWRRRSCHG